MPSTPSAAELMAAFDTVAPNYEASAPPYPQEAIRWLVPLEAERVVDLGAGTGQVTRHLAAFGLDTVAVEPAPVMRSEFSRTLPDVPVLDGSAERIPLPDASVDAVVVGNAWQCVDVERAVREIARILRPGGRLGLVWSIRNERVDWVRELAHLIHWRPSPKSMADSENPCIGGPFAPIERADFEWVQSHSLVTLKDLVQLRVGGITFRPEERTRTLALVEEFFERTPELALREQVSLPFITRCSRTYIP